MIFSIVKWTIISLTLIFLIHHLYTFLMNTLTVPKIKDLVNKPKEQYNDLFQTMQQQGISASNEKIQGISASNEKIQGISASNEKIQGISASNQREQGTGTQGISASNQKIQQHINTSSSKDMTDELSSFLNDLKKKGGENYMVPDNNIVSEFSNESGFSAF